MSVCIFEFDGLPGPVGLPQCRVIYYGGQQGWEGPQQNSGEELTDNSTLQTQHTVFTPLHFMSSIPYTCSVTYVQIVNGLGDIKFVHGGDDDGGRCEEEEEEKEGYI